MLNREEELSIYIKNRWPLLEIWNIENGVCACSREDCQTPGKHPVKGQQSARPYANTIALKRNVGVMCGQGFVVLDIDPRNGGNETLAALEAKHGALPPTWTVCTGGGGEHRYFEVSGEQPSQNGLKAEGVELKGVGSYVLCPTSNHASGRIYEWCPELSPEDLPIAPLPAWVLEATKCEVCLERSRELNESADGPSEVYSKEDVCCALRTISAECSEKEWKDIACALISGGFGIDLWDEWSKSAAEKYPGRAEIERVWNLQVSRMRKAPAGRKITLGTLIYRAQEAGWIPAPVESPLLGVSEGVCLERSIEVAPVEDAPLAESTEEGPVVPPNAGNTALRLTAQGLIGELACWMFDTSVREYDEFAVAGALAILSTCAQGSYKTWDGRSLSLYQICLLPAAGGKDHYLTSVEDVLHHVDARLVMSMPGSSHGMRGDLFAWNSRILCMDEVQDFFSKMGSTDNVFVSQVMSDIKELYNGKRRWKGSSLKTQVMPDVLHPRLTWLGFGTPSRFKQTINSNMVGGGLISRILLWDVENVPERHRTYRKRPFDPNCVGVLRRLSMKGVGGDFRCTGTHGLSEALGKYHSGKECTHVPQTTAEEDLTITPEAEHRFGEYDKEGEALYLAMPDSSDGAIHDRASTQVAIVASLHALGCRRTDVRLEDVEWAIAVARRTIEPMALMARTWMADSVGEKTRQRILHALSRGSRTRHHLLRGLRLSTKDFDQAASDLLEMKLIKSTALPRLGRFPLETVFELAKNPNKC